jgi:hypothetical protein
VVCVNQKAAGLLTTITSQSVAHGRVATLESGIPAHFGAVSGSNAASGLADELEWIFLPTPVRKIIQSR